MELGRSFRNLYSLYAETIKQRITVLRRKVLRSALGRNWTFKCVFLEIIYLMAAYEKFTKNIKSTHD